MKNTIKLVATDLDGTLLNSGRCVSKKDFQTLIRLGEESVIRVLATGRNLFSLQKVIPPEFPIDYLVFSSGAGIIDWKTQHILKKSSIPANEVDLLISRFEALKLDFMVHKPVPGNHHFGFVKSNQENSDFQNRLEIYKPFCFPWHKTKGSSFGPASQFLAITPPENVYYQRVKRICNNHHLVRATSPLDLKSMWLEVFPKGVSKSEGVDFVCKKHSITQKEIMAVGNDYNDLDLLRWSPFSAVVANAPKPVKSGFHVVASNNEHGFSMAVNHFMA